MEFLGSLALLLIGGIATGLLFPLVKSASDQRSSRAHALVSSRVSAFEELAKILWEYQYLAMRVAYTAIHEHEDYEEARTQFHKRGWDVLKDCRTKIAGLRWLMSDEQHKKITKQYLAWVNELNSKEPEYNANEDAWDRYKDILLEYSAPKLDSILSSVARGFELPSSEKHLLDTLKQDYLGLPSPASVKEEKRPKKIA